VRGKFEAKFNRTGTASGTVDRALPMLYRFSYQRYQPRERWNHQYASTNQ
jgi:hypothetical protein